MSHPEEYDVIVLGSGAPGKLLAWTLGSRGRRVAVVERRYIGGSCPNIACLPSKNVIHAARVASLFRRGEEFGLISGGWKVVRHGRRGLPGSTTSPCCSPTRATWASSSGAAPSSALRPI